ncbi:HNH endonuclease [Streptacidiphilus sp. EB129]|uniref:HNH endonuclease n=1 Tax=Streptacidiphilus sp. EB129 TaxID=3156262 RepID=UPI0035170241
MGSGWLVLAVEDDDRTHGSNGGYDDQPDRHYSWDSTVPNHARLAAGDVIALWDKRALLGVSVIDSITVGNAVKDRYSCPVCGKADIKRRKTRRPVYRCDCGAEFDRPVTTPTPVTTYRSDHEAAWVDLAGAVDGPTLRALCDSPDSQHSLRPMRWDRLRTALEDAGAGVPTSIVENTLAQIVGGHRLATTRARIGQGQFRRRLLAEQGEVCAFTGPAPAAALEAAHLYSYASLAQHDQDGGLLLRRDVHSLFDLGYLAVDPQPLVLDVVPQVRNFPLYAGLHGAPVAVRLSRGQRAWLADHWALHRTSTA